MSHTRHSDKAFWFDSSDMDDDFFSSSYELSKPASLRNFSFSSQRSGSSTARINTMIQGDPLNIDCAKENVFAELCDFMTKRINFMTLGGHKTSPVKKKPISSSPPSMKTLRDLLIYKEQNKDIDALNKDIQEMNLHHGRNFNRMMNAAKQYKSLIEKKGIDAFKIDNDSSENFSFIEKVILERITTKYPLVETKWLSKLMTIDRQSRRYDPYDFYDKTVRVCQKNTLSKKALEPYMEIRLASDYLKITHEEAQQILGESYVPDEVILRRSQQAIAIHAEANQTRLPEPNGSINDIQTDENLGRRSLFQ